MRRTLKFTLAACFVTVVLIGGVFSYQRYKVRTSPPPATESIEPTSEDLAYRFHTTLTSEEKRHVLDGDFTVISSVESLPGPIKNAFATITGDKPFALADPGKKYQMTDVIDEPGLPVRRLVLAGVYKDRWFIHYEHGGIGVSSEVLVLKTEANGDMRFLWGGSGSFRATGLNDLREAIANGKFADDAAYYR